MIVKKIYPGYNFANCYLAFDKKTREGIMIDPGGMADRLIGEIKKEGVDIKYIFITHAHFDHIGALEEVAEYTKAKVVIYKAEENALTDEKLNLAYLAGAVPNRRGADITVGENDVIEVGEMKFSFIHTPGHTAGGMCIFDGKETLFTGDTLFCGSIGRSDFPGGNFGVLKKSLEKLMKLDDKVRIYPGHEEESTIGAERKTNPYIV